MDKAEIEKAIANFEGCIIIREAHECRYQVDQDDVDKAKAALLATFHKPQVDRISQISALMDLDPPKDSPLGMLLLEMVGEQEGREGYE